MNDLITTIGIQAELIANLRREVQALRMALSQVEEKASKEPELPLEDNNDANS